MAYKILDGGALASKIKQQLRAQIKSKNISLGTILVGNDPASEIYVGLKHKDCRDVGIKSIDVRLPFNATEKQVIEQIKKLNRTVTGYIVQMPLPSHLNTSRIISAIDPLKDADAIAPYNLGQLENPATPKPCTPLGIVELLKEYKVNLVAANAVVVGRSKTVGIPVSMLLINENATVTICHSKTKNLAKKVSEADIVIVATGSKWLIKGVKKGACVVDVGVTRDKSTRKIYGDVHPQVYKDAKFVSLPTGGVGPMTRVMLLKNVVSLYRQS